ncbi:hypothetical protein N7532_003541 [Penicillium argentinense]|uniref:G-protein coupled receptors family 2 profile 2 domain-containing protein n=1 Tax=Penicillium argentinense TaxID=1131581 RepID=A0A9W9FN34_9EURO|nr:uncharacterized protein N7532_003541 [Penicillium argentinense]KAJ5103012.1 hypothetical protein N7532_003541 [Penicillium argentinense]
MISISGPDAGDTSSLCQFQGFALQMFPIADVLWTFAMALDTYLVVFHRFDTHSLQKLERWYLSLITVLTFIPALVFLFIHTPAKGPIYGSETIWCSISPNWMLIRIVLYYGPVWLVISVVLIFYFLIGVEISRLRDEFKLTEDDHIALTSNLSSQAPAFENPTGTVTTTVEATKPKMTQTSDVRVTSETSVEHIITPRLASSKQFPINYNAPTQRRMSFKQYVLMPSLFFLALLATWVAPTINRVSAFIRPGYESYPLLLAVTDSINQSSGFGIAIQKPPSTWDISTLDP